MKSLFLSTLPPLIFLFSCQEKPEKLPSLFREIPAEISGVDFRNDLSFDEKFNVFTYRNYYNGGGVAIGDVNNDGLADIYFTANLSPNRLYLNKGDFKFEDVTEMAGVAGTRAWSTGVAMADVNGDGWLDIYVCNSGDVSGDNKQNELFINQGDGTFSEQAEAYGLDDHGFSTHAVFFDYDKDGDLDVYLLNNSYAAIGSINKIQNERTKRDPVGGDKLFKNEGGKFVDVSEEAGIFGSIIGFGLGVSVGDLNQDGWPDIFISNDFFERDYLYLNNQDGTFSESLESAMRSISTASMGSDIADVNGDGLLDLFVSDMLPEPLPRLKQVTTFENWDKFQFNKTHSYHYQFSRNMLHINNGDGTFSEMGRLANIEATDWSWGALIFDMDNDGMRDLFVANGIYQDITDLDYLNFIDNEETKIKIISQNGVDYKALIDPIPITPVSNYAFKNLGDLKFENRAKAWGLDQPIHSNGAAYGDLDNDGTLDLVINNVNSPAVIFKNQGKMLNPEKHSIQFQLLGKGKNTQAIGAQIRVTAGDQVFYSEQMPNRGFQSSVDPKLTLGLGEITQVEKIEVIWPDGKVSELTDQAVDQLITLKWGEATTLPDGKSSLSEPPATQFSKEENPGLKFTHTENPFVDFDRDRLTYFMFSTEGPAFAKGDVNGDGLEDLYFGGAKSFSGKLFLADPTGNYREISQADFIRDAPSEDTDAIFFDADGDGDLDLFVTSGGNESAFGAPDLADRLYLNDGTGNFSKKMGTGFSTVFGSSSTVQTIDINGDGALDLFVGERLVPFAYGAPASSHLWINDGTGNFSEHSATFAPALKELGMVTDSRVVDWDGDGRNDLVVVGEWMAPTLFRNSGETLEKIQIPSLTGLKGWYRTVETGDFDGDGRIDLVLGNHGLNTRFKASITSPVTLFLNDFDQNGSIEQLYTKKIGEARIPYTLKNELERQVPSIKKKYIRHADYNSKSLDEIFSREIIDKSIIQEVSSLESGVLMNKGGGNFEWKPFPRMSQKSWIFAIQVIDLNGDGQQDLILGGNLAQAKPEVGKLDASYGEVLIGKGDGTFTYSPNRENGLKLEGDIRAFSLLGEKRILVVKNSGNAEIWKF